MRLSWPYLGICLFLAAALAVAARAVEEPASTEPLVLSVRAQAVSKPRESSAVFPAERKGCIPLAAKPPAIDGTIGEEEWKDAGVYCGFSARNGFAKSPTFARACRDEANLYLAFRCALPPGNSALSASTKRDLDVWQDEAVEIFIDPGRTKKVYYQFILNTLGTQQDSKGFQSSWNAKWESKTRVGKECWEAEIAIPFSALGVSPPKPGEVWGLNLNHDDKRSGEHSSWSHLGAGAHDPERFGVVAFDTPPELEILASAASIPAGGEARWQICSVNRGAQPAKGKLTLAAENGPKTQALDLELPSGIATHALTGSYAGVGKGSAGFAWQGSGGETLKGEELFWRKVEPISIRLRACENESYLGERSIGVMLLSEQEDIANVSIEFALLRKNDSKLLRASKLAGLPAGECRCELSTAGLEPGAYSVRAKIFGADGKALGEDAVEFVRTKSPFE